MKSNTLFKDDVEYTSEQVLNVLRKNQQYSVTLFYNIRGWSSTFTTEPTGATPTGVLYKDGFPAKVRVYAENQWSELRVKPMKYLH